MAEWHPLNGPSSEAQAFIADPANRNEDPFDAAQLPAQRAEGRQTAEADAPALCEAWRVSLRWCQVADRACLEVTPSQSLTEGTLIFLFGGGFVTGGPLEDLQIIAPLAAETGMRVLAPVYALAPENPWPAALDDVKAVLREVAPMGPYQLAGESAGGNLAVCAVQGMIAQALPTPSALALLSPAVDLSAAFDPLSAPDDPTLNVSFIAGVPKVYAGTADPADPGISPIYGAFAGDWPDTIITTGTQDRFLGQCARLAHTIRAAGGLADLRLWDGLWHVFEYYPEIPEAGLSLSEIAAFLRARSEGGT